MEVRPGYKQTEVGVIPADWVVVDAGSIGSFRGGNGFPTAYQGMTSGKYPFFKVSDMNSEGNETFMELAHNYISEETRTRLGANAFPPKTIVFAKVGAAVFLERKKILTKASCLDNNMAGYVISDARADHRYIHYFMLNFRLGSLVSTTALPSLNGGVLRGIKIPLPTTKSEQEAIAEALSDADALIESLEQLLVKKRHLKRGAMQELLTGKKRLPGFSGDWDSMRLRELLSYERPDKYIVQDTEYSERGDIPVLTANKSFVLGYTVESFGICRELPAIVFDDFTTASRFVDFPFKVKSSAIKLLRPKHDRVDLTFVFERMQLIRFPLGDHKRYYISEFQNLEVGTPDLAEQMAIAAVLSDMDAEIAALGAGLAKARRVKQGMMHELLTGKIRLV